MRPTVFLFGDFQQLIRDIIQGRGTQEDLQNYDAACVQAGKLLNEARKLKEAGRPVHILHVVADAGMGDVGDASQYVTLPTDDNGDDPSTLRKTHSQMKQMIKEKYSGDHGISEHVAPKSDERVMGRPTANPFFDTTLTKDLRDLGMQNIVISGVATSGIVLASVQGAYERGLNIAVVQDACSDFGSMHKDMMSYFAKRCKVITMESKPDFAEVLD